MFFSLYLLFGNNYSKNCSYKLKLFKVIRIIDERKKLSTNFEQNKELQNKKS